MGRAMRGWKEMKVSNIAVEMFLMGRLFPCEHEVRHYVAVDSRGELHCLELINGDLHLCVDELNFYWDQGAE